MKILNRSKIVNLLMERAMKKAVIVWSGPNVDGLTASAKDQIMKGLTDAGAEVTEIHLNKKRLEHCRACGNGWGTCRTKGACVIQDDFADIYQTLAKSDGIVGISAVYWSDMTEAFKAFFDRLRRCDAACSHDLADKRCVLIACAGGTGRGTLECLTQLERGLTHTAVPRRALPAASARACVRSTFRSLSF